MKLPFSSSIRLALAISALFVLMALLAGAVTYALQTRAMSNQLAGDVKGLAAGLAQIAGQGDRQDLIEQTVALSGSVGDGSLIAIFTDAKSGESFGNATLAAPVTGARELVVGRDVTLKPQAGDRPDAYFAYGIATPFGDVLVGKDDGPLLENQRILLAAIAWGLGGAAALSILLALVIARFNEERIARIGSALDAVGSGRYSVRIGPMGGDDLGHLAAMVDRMLDQLVAGIDAIRRVSTDVAHDLRAPLGRLRIRLEPLALSAELPPAARHEIGSALAQIDAISATFDAILRLARLESGAVELAMKQIDLCQLLREVSEVFGSAAEEGSTIALDLPDGPLQYSGDRDMLAQAVVNLLHNGLRHCPHPVHIRLGLRNEGGRVVMSVADDGPGIPLEDRERVMQRFVRLDESRSTPGTGLGLSLVSAIAELHGGRIELLDNHPGLRVEISLPGSGQAG